MPSGESKSSFKMSVAIRFTSASLFVPPEKILSRSSSKTTFSGKAWPKRGLATPNALAICVGDLFSFTNTKSRKALASALAGGASDGVQQQLDDLIFERVERLASEMEDIAPRVVATIQGNHGYQFSDGQMSDEKVANLLDIPFTPGACLARFNLSAGGHRASFTCLAHHGAGGAGTESSDLNNLVRKSEPWVADIFVMGHSHHLYAHSARPRLVPFGTPPRLKSVWRWLGRTGSFVKAYGENAGYVEKALLPPSHIGYLKFTASIENPS